MKLLQKLIRAIVTLPRAVINLLKPSQGLRLVILVTHPDGTCTEGNKTMNLTSEQKRLLTVSAKDSSLNPVALPAVPTWTSSDETIVKVAVVSVDGATAYAAAVGPVGEATITVQCGKLTKSLPVTVTAAEAASLEIAVGEAEAK